MRYFNMAQLFGESKKRERTRISMLFKAHLYNQDTGDTIEEWAISPELQQCIDFGDAYKQVTEWIKNNCGKTEHGFLCGQFSDMWLDCYSDDKEASDPPNISFRFENVNYILYWSHNQA